MQMKFVNIMMLRNLLAEDDRSADIADQCIQHIKNTADIMVELVRQRYPDIGLSISGRGTVLEPAEEYTPDGYMEFGVTMFLEDGNEWPEALKNVDVDGE